jgi:uncharacterized protein DUF6941
MPTRVWSHISDYASFVQGTSIIIREFNQIYLAPVPAVYPVFYVISKWKGAFNEQYTYAVKITSPSAAEILTTPVEQVKITGGPNGTEHVSVTQLINTSLPVFGEYKVRLLINGTTVHSMPLHVFMATR